MGTLAYNNTDISYDIHGPSSGRAKGDIVFLHGLGADKRQSSQFLNNITGYRIITVDMPGHGDSYLPEDFNSDDQAKSIGFQAYADVVSLLVKSLQLSSFVIGGISMGAAIALKYALSNPENIIALLMVRPAWLDQPASPHLDIISHIGDWLSRGDQAYAEDQLVSHPHFHEIMNVSPLCAGSVKGAIYRPQAITAGHVLSNLAADQPFTRLEDIKNCKALTLVIGNDHDPLHPVYIAEKLASILPKAEYFLAPAKYLHSKAHQAAADKKISGFLNKALDAKTSLITKT